MNELKLFHIGITREQGAEYAILTGDPGRVESIAESLDSPMKLAYNREFNSFVGTLCGERVIVISTGIGGPSAAITLEELSMAGLRYAVRIGTCGAMQPDIIPGTLIVPTAAVRMEGTSKEYAPIEFPAAADHSVLNALVAAAKKAEQPYRVGVIQSKDSFYGQHCPETMPVDYELTNKWNAWVKLGVLASEMECAALFTVGAVRGVKMGCVLHALWNQERKKLGIADDDSFDMSAPIKVAVDALKTIIKENKNG